MRVANTNGKSTALLCSAKTPYNAEKCGFGEQNLARSSTADGRGPDAMIDVYELSQVEPVGVSRSS